MDIDIGVYFCGAVVLAATIFAVVRCLARQKEPINFTIEVMPTIEIMPAEAISQISEQRRRRRRSRRPVTPPPEFNSALINSTPIYYIQMEEDHPPPTYTDYLEMQKGQNGLKQEDLVQFYV
jgi:hypothetical protein